MAGEIDPMHQFLVEPMFGPKLMLGQYDVSFTNSALFMFVVLGVLWVFMLGGMKRQLVPGRWQVAVESMIGFVDDMMRTNIGPEGKKYAPYIFSPFMFILIANLIGVFPFAIIPGVTTFCRDQPHHRHGGVGVSVVRHRAGRRVLEAWPAFPGRSSFRTARRAG